MNQELLEQVRTHWQKTPCGTEYTQEKKYSRAYFDAIEQLRYTVEPEIFSFAQFTRYHGKKMLEVGVGAGTDFLQWVRAGADAHGVDLTQHAVDHVTERLAQYKLTAKEIRVANAQQLPYPDNSFDLVYSWGVIHHAPDTQQCLRKLIRVAKPGSQIKLMIYNRRSLFAFYQYLLHALAKGRPFQTIATVLYNHQESKGTKAFTRAELRAMLAGQPVTLRSCDTTVTNHDLLYYKSWPFRTVAYLTATLFGWKKVGWFMRVTLEKKDTHHAP